jgi:hypothetical protein
MIKDQEGFQIRHESYCAELSLFTLLYLDSLSYLD